MSKRKADDLIEREISKDSGKTEYLLKNGQHRIAYGKEERDNSSEVCKTGERSELESYITIKQISKATGEETGSGSTVTTDSNNYILITVDLSNNTNIRYDRAVAAILRLYMVTWSGALRIGIYKAVPTIGACYTKGDKIDTFADDTVLHGDSIVRCNIINDFVSDHIAVRQYLLDIDDHTTNWTCYNNTQLCYRPTLTVDYIPYLEIRKRQSYIEGNVGAGGHFAVKGSEPVIL